MDYSRPELADRLAADYVSGTLRGPARRRFESLLVAHPGLREAMRRWQDRLMPLTGVVDPVPPSAQVWAAIEARIDPGATTRPSTQRWWHQLNVWRALATLATTAALIMGLALTQPGPAVPPIVVVLSAAASPASSATGAGSPVIPASFVASISGDGRSMVTRPLTEVPLEANRALELWALPRSGPPRSLGVISPSQATVVQRQELLRGTQAFAVTVEPARDAPHQAPTGPVVYLGKLVL